jgi:hypothetical protein
VKIPPWTHPEIAKMMIGCWVPNPDSRPSFEYIVDFLERTFPQVRKATKKKQTKRDQIRTVVLISVQFA